MKDVKTILIEDKKITTQIARRSAEIVSSAVAETQLESLEHHALGEIQDWRDHDEHIVWNLRGLLNSDKKLPTHFPDGIYAAHVVAAAVMAGLAKGSKVGHLFERMKQAIKSMHNANPSWGPLFVTHPGDISRHLARVRPRRPRGGLMSTPPSARITAATRTPLAAASVRIASKRKTRVD